MNKQTIICTFLMTILSTWAVAQESTKSNSPSLGFYFQPEYSSMFLKDHIGNTVGFALGITSRNDKWDFGIHYYGRSGPINLHKEYELVLPEGTTYKGNSSVMLGVDQGYLGLEAAYNLATGNERFTIRIPISFGQFGAGFYLKGKDRFTPDGQRTSVWEDQLQGGSDAGFGFCSEFGTQIIYQVSPSNKHFHLMTGVTYMNTYGYESFLGGTDFYNNKIRASFGFRFDF